MSRHVRRARASVAVTTAALAALAAAPTSTATSPPPRPGPRVVATGLDNPRHLSFSDSGALYVAEAGRGGAGPCLAGPEGAACLGRSGAITRVAHGAQSRVVTGLPSLAGADGNRATGPADVDVRGSHQIAILMGLGGNPAVRATLGRPGALFGTVLAGWLGSRRPGLRVVADVAAYEATKNPVPPNVDSNPTSLLRQGHDDTVVVDAGGNDLIKLGRHSRTLAVFPTTQVAAPPFLGLPPGAKIPMEAVPTSVAVGPDRAYYVSQLTGFPFPVGGSTIWRVAPGKAPTPYATGLTNVTDLAWRGGQLYAVQLADDGLLAAGPNPPIGSLRRILPGGSTHPAVGPTLTAPYGLALRGSTAYVTTCSVCAGGGGVTAIPLP